MAVKANVFKVETFGAVDGPGVRLVLFLQGCNFRCKYCHNPESWNLKSNQAKKMSISDILSLYKRNSPFYEKGGITLSGGEPMLSADFIKSFSKVCKQKKIKLAIDTAACNFMSNKQLYLDVLNDIDLWIVDIKAMQPKEHEFITGHKSLTGIEFIKFLESKKKPYWIRQVIVKGINDDQQHLQQLADFIRPLKYCKRWELLSYHNLATEKYEKLKINYPLADIKVLTNTEFDAIKSTLNNLVYKK